MPNLAMSARRQAHRSRASRASAIANEATIQITSDDAQAEEAAPNVLVDQEMVDDDEDGDEDEEDDDDGQGTLH